MSALPHPPHRYSVYAESRREVLEFKWLESEKVGYDLGDKAVAEWIRQHWDAFVRARLIEHLEGKRFWSELDCDDFGLLKCAFQDDPFLLGRIVDHLRCGQENLPIIVWAFDCEVSICRLHSILESININGRRLDPIWEPTFGNSLQSS